MTIDEFKKIINLREIERCCATCEHGCPEYDYGYRCYLPQVDENRGKIGEDYMIVDDICCCDEWEERRHLFDHGRR